MAQTKRDFTNPGFVKTFVLPSILIFLIPAISLAFFLHARSLFDSRIRDSITEQVGKDQSLTPQDREKAIAFFAENPISSLLDDPRFAGMVDSTTRMYYASFHWLILLSAGSLALGVVAFLLAGLCVVASRRSQRALYLSLALGWQGLRLYGAFQTLAQGVMIIALSFWVTALWFHVYYVKLIVIAGLLALSAGVAVIAAIFKRPPKEFPVEGVFVDRASAPALWSELERICGKVGAKPPDNVIAGIDDNFFVTEIPVTAAGEKRPGRTLYASLSLLKQMNGAEADSVLAHEMAHFSGNDTLFSKKISPLLNRYAMYLGALHENPIARPVYHFMLCFRALYELSLGERSRSREFRADGIAAEATSGKDFAGAMLRIAAYSDFRAKIQNELFETERALESANIAERLEEGFLKHAVAFAAQPDIGGVATAHPFDSHPPMAERLAAVGAPLEALDAAAMVSEPGDGRWFDAIPNAEALEKAQWDEFEARFRTIHEQSLAYRLLPENDEELAIVAKWFPEATIAGKKVTLTLDCLCVRFSKWDEPIAFRDITNCTMNNNVLEIRSNGGKRKEKIAFTAFPEGGKNAFQAFNAYYSRFMSAAAYQKHKRETAKPSE